MVDVDGSCAGMTRTERRIMRRYYLELGISMVAYVALLFVSLATVGGVHGPLKAFDALLPMAGVLGTTVALVRFGLAQDELQRRTFIDAGALAAAIAGVATMTLGFLENAGVPRISMTFVWPMLVFVWGIAYAFLRSRR